MTSGPPTVKPTKRGKKIGIYADTGLGKSTLAAMSPKPVFIDLDHNTDELVNPITGVDLSRIPGVETFPQLRTTLQTHSNFIGYDTVVVDNVTVAQNIAEPYMFETIKTDKGHTVKNIEGYGYHKGYKHLYDTMRFILADCDSLIAAGKNVILIAQSSPGKVANTAGDDYLREGPRLNTDKNWSIEALYCEWFTHLFRIAHQSVVVDEKKVTGDVTRIIQTQPEIYFRAKTKGPALADKPVVTFATPSDDSLWRFLFNGQ